MRPGMPPYRPPLKRDFFEAFGDMPDGDAVEEVQWYVAIKANVRNELHNTDNITLANEIDDTDAIEWGESTNPQEILALERDGYVVELYPTEEQAAAAMNEYYNKLEGSDEQFDMYTHPDYEEEIDLEGNVIRPEDKPQPGIRGGEQEPQRKEIRGGKEEVGEPEGVDEFDGVGEVEPKDVQGVQGGEPFAESKDSCVPSGREEPELNSEPSATEILRQAVDVVGTIQNTL